MLKNRYHCTMKKLVLLTALCLLVIAAFGQNKVFYKVKTSPSNTLYIGLNNPISLADSSLMIKGMRLVLKFSNGQLVQRNNIYYILPLQEGKAILSVLQVKGKDTVELGQQVFVVKPAYMPVLGLSNTVLDSVISRAALMKEQHLRVLMPESDYDVRFALNNCKIRFPNGRIYPIPQGVMGYRIKMEVSRLKIGDKICFESTQILGFTGAEQSIDNACYTLVE